MKKIYFPVVFSLLICGFITANAQVITGPKNEKFGVRVVADKLSDPWEVAYGPDKHLWITEAHGYRVSRINPANGTKTVLLDLSAERQFPRYDKLPKSVSGGKPWPQGGLMGMALHPQLLSGQPYVYLIYVYKFAGADSAGNGCKINSGGCFFTARIVRYEYNIKQQKLINATTVCDSIPASSDHNGGRLTIAPVNGKSYLFYSIGDLGAGQFGNGGRPNHAQDKNIYEGKILRFNLTADQDAHYTDQWIPNDNPFNGAKQNAVWSYGHRNPQGLSYAVINGIGRLYSSEHGPYSDDEINIIEKGKNYGHPLIIGYADNNYNGLAASVSDNAALPGVWHTTYPLIENEQNNARQIGADYRDPIKTLYPLTNSFLTDFFNKTKSGADGGEWQSEAPSSIEIYTSNTIPGWKNSVLLPCLKGKKLVRLQLNAAGNKVISDTINYFKGDVRYRDIAISPDGGRLYLTVDSTSVTSGPSEQNPEKTTYRGCVLEFSYQGQSNKNTPASKTNLPAKVPQRKRESE
ncbi:PQQ-dependent sugar dehydrogenase [Mucilaginibacter lacusdianchii]|uniref:PQQ-dependent sugar dehydrogenase n=1 Tax=Mucilaginibacter lacusdianchii TaxID=2684211 RepID=UPI00131D3894|nr:PQQ-dependent sugar dehydrogenase [Mucilaginibacter sp. JXJ CY 39]